MFKVPNKAKLAKVANKTKLAKLQKLLTPPNGQTDHDTFLNQSWIEVGKKL